MEGDPTKKEKAIQFPEITHELDAMRDVDQKMRSRALAEGYWDVTIDANNTARMKQIVAHIGWPTIKRVGQVASENAWLLVQHADHDIAFQEQCLELMKQEASGAVNPRNIAMLEDRIRVNRNQPQIYGTQFRDIDGQHKPLPIEDEESVNERRKLMGLGTLEEGIRGMYEKYGAPEQG